jgi:hypothetical protein
MRNAELRLLPATGASARGVVASRRGVTVHLPPGNEASAPHFPGVLRVLPLVGCADLPCQQRAMGKLTSTQPDVVASTPRLKFSTCCGGRLQEPQPCLMWLTPPMALSLRWRGVTVQQCGPALCAPPIGRCSPCTIGHECCDNLSSDACVCFKAGKAVTPCDNLRAVKSGLSLMVFLSAGRQRGAGRSCRAAGCFRAANPRDARCPGHVQQKGRPAGLQVSSLAVAAEAQKRKPRNFPG